MLGKETQSLLGDKKTVSLLQVEGDLVYNKNIKNTEDTNFSYNEAQKSGSSCTQCHLPLSRSKLNCEKTSPVCASMSTFSSSSSSTKLIEGRR